jgi:hypothetical protein
MTQKNVHVVPSNGRWGVKIAGKSEPITTCRKQETAIGRGKTIAKDSSVELFIHGRDGKIRDRASYGNDPCPPKDKH